MATALDDRLMTAQPRSEPWEDVWRRFRQHHLAVVGLIVIATVAVLSVVAPLLTRLGVIADPREVSFSNLNATPSSQHPFGTDYLGRDLLARTLYGARMSLSIGVVIQLVVVFVGGTIGLTAGYFGGKVDNLLMRLTDAMFAFPDLLFVLVIASVLGGGYWNIVIAVGAVNWAHLARLVRGEVLTINTKDYIAAATVSGTRSLQMLKRHVVPNAAGPVIVSVTFGIPAAIFIEAFLSFIGVGVHRSTPSWGVMIQDGYAAIFGYPHEIVPPAVAICMTVLSFNFIADGLREALDPDAMGRTSK